MNPIYWWIIRDILGMRRDPRIRTERRCRWGRAMGFALILAVPVALWAIWMRMP